MRKSISQLKEENAELIAENAELAKKLSSSESTSRYHSEAATRSQAEVEQVHILLDVLPGCLPRKTVPDKDRDWNIVSHTLITRLASYLAMPRS